MPLPFTTSLRLGHALGALIFLCSIITGRAERACTTVGSTILENFDTLANFTGTTGRLIGRTPQGQLERGNS